jgi:sphinganine-1-phosphate aldolase
MGEKKVKMPEKGIPRDQVLKELDGLHKNDADWKKGRTWSLVYYAGDEHADFLKAAYANYMSENGLSPVAFPSLKKFEAEVVSMTADMLGGDDKVAGTMTGGGTESILMAVKTYRDRAREKKPDIKVPEMVLPDSAHPAFEKAAHYFDVKSARIPVGPDFRADTAAMKAAINENTILLVGSAPCYPHGVVDPIPDLAAIALESGLPLHVDSCLGGYLLPFVKRLGYPVPDYDFRVKGVTSISADAHKYGYAAKGASVVLYRNSDLRRYQFCIFTDWSGGIYGSPSMAGSRPGGSIAAAWATLRAFGQDGYMNNAERIMKTTTALIEGINGIPGLRVLGKPAMSVFAFASDEVDAYAVADAMEAREWHMDRQADPLSLHLMVSLAHENVVDDFLKDLRESVEFVRANPKEASKGAAAMYGMMATLPDRGMVKDFVFEFLDSLYTV